jgi:hypothetical protein
VRIASLAQAWACALLLASPLAAQTMRNYSVGRPVAEASQPPLRALLEFGAGRVLVRASTGNALYDARLRYDAERFTPVHQYQPRTGTLRLGLESIGRAGFRVTSRNDLEQVARFEFAPNVPLSLEAALGASEAVLDLGGLTLNELYVRSGATRGSVDFTSPTLGTCRQALFAIGAAELMAMRLANAGCERVRVEGGMGRAVLDFSGTWRRDVAIEAALAMGSLTLRIPRDVGVQISAERFLTRLDVKGLERDGNTWRTPGFAEATRKLSLTLKASVSGMDIEWID